MSQATILFADNDPDFLSTRAEFLEEEEYNILRVVNPTEARRALEQGKVDVAIVDLRLRDDGDEKDRSGLTLAREVARQVPKIILTGYSFSWEVVRDALRPLPDGPPPAVDFVTKGEGAEALLRSVRRAIRGPLAQPGKEYSWSAIHALLCAAFTAKELKRFCSYRDLFRPVIDETGSEPSVSELADALIEYSRKRLYVAELLAELEAENPRQFRRYRDRLYREL